MITIEAIEALADKLEADEKETRSKLQRLVRAYARILAVREPEAFPRQPVEFSDEDGHWDNSFPPKKEYKDYSGPRLLEIEDGDWDEVATSGGFYHEWRATTSSRGLFVSRSGVLFGATYEGSGRVGQFAAHHGNCGVMITVEYDALDEEDIATEALRTVERVIRARAFPLATERAKQQDA